MAEEKDSTQQMTRQEIFKIIKRRAGKALLGMAAVGILEEAMKPIEPEKKFEGMRPYVEDIDDFAQMAGVELTREALETVYDAFGADIGVAASLYEGRPTRIAEPHAIAKPEETRSRRKPKTLDGSKTPGSEYVTLSMLVSSVRTPRHPYKELMNKLSQEPGADELIDGYGARKQRVPRKNIDAVMALLNKYKTDDKDNGTESTAPEGSSGTGYRRLSDVVNIAGTGKLGFRKIMSMVLEDEQAQNLIERHRRGYRVAAENIEPLKQIIKGYASAPV